MADTTSHDTVGASTLATPLFMPSSPPHSRHDFLASPDRARSPIEHTDEHSDDAHSPIGSPPGSPPSSRFSSLDRAAKELDARLADYTVDFDRFPSGHVSLDDGPLGEPKLPHEDHLSDVGGPEDFTANLEKYLMGDDDTFEHREEGDDDHSILDEQELPRPESPEPKEQEPSERQHHSRLHQSGVEDEVELGEYSEFAPVDMSTPSHLLRRGNALSRDATRLENIEEDPDDEPDLARTPSVRKHRSTPSADQRDIKDDLLREIAELKQALQEKDDQLERNHRRVLEAASAGEQIKHLQSELMKKTAVLDDIHAQHSDDTVLREQIQLLQKQNEQKESLLQKSTVQESKLTALQEQIADLKQELQTRPMHTDIDAERLETITYLRQQLTMAQEQLKKRDATLDDTLAKLAEVTTAKEQQLREKNTEVDELRAQVDDNLLEIQKLEADVEQGNREYRTLEDRLTTLEIRNQPLEEKNSTLEADLSRAQSQVTAHETALRAMAGDLTDLTSTGTTYAQIMDLIENINPAETNRLGEAISRTRSPKDELEHARMELARAQTQLAEATSAQTALEAQLTRSQEQASEARTLINSIEGENSRLSKRAEELKAYLDKANRELNGLKEDYSEAQGTIKRLQDEKNNIQQPSPPPSPPSSRRKEAALEESHQAQLKSLQAAHATAVSTLRASHADSTRKLRDLVADAEKREAQLKSELQTLRQSQRTQDSETKSLRAEVKRLESVIAIKDETAAELDQRISRTVDKREKEWQRRIERLLEERDRMGKAFLWVTGEKELGENKESRDDSGRRKQAYRYKHALKNGSKKV
ncbi:hypothetical protein BDV25DRAFT_164701 [Aspergillus avenaceus]|uniref:Spindle pole body associated protein SnaD n=1 Tax=Aspergillus avenaceus TaxID=36643 RepID=A0A5N6TGK3_ASPAV|nr:hypothetical protein BDV25DRAFT_164701 [Aspergillus avenaceus]